MPFFLPSSFHHNYRPEEIPQECCARFKAQVRHQQYRYFFDAQLVVFSPDRFAIIRFSHPTLGPSRFFLFVRKDNER